MNPFSSCFCWAGALHKLWLTLATTLVTLMACTTQTETPATPTSTVNMDESKISQQPTTPVAADAEIHYGMIRALHQEGSSNFIPYVDQHTIQYQDQITGKVKSKPMINKLLYQLSKGDIDLDTFIERQTENVSWISDDSPFFYQMKKKIPNEILVVLTTTVVLLFFLTLFFKISPTGKKQNFKNYFFLATGLAFLAARSCCSLGFY